MTEERICEKCCNESTISIFKIFGNGLNIPVLQITGVLSVGVTFLSSYYGFSITNILHITFTTFGLSLLISEAIMIIPNKQFCGPLTPNQNALIHGFLVTLGSMFTIGGITIIVKYKSDHKMEHYGTIHAITGLTAMILLSFTLFLGTILVLFKYILKFFDMKFSENTIFWWELPHHIIGSLGYAIGMGSLCCGIGSTEFSSVVPYNFRVVLVIMAIVVAVWTMICSFMGICAILNKLVSVYDGRNDLEVQNFDDYEGETSGRQEKKHVRIGRCEVINEPIEEDDK